MAFQLGRCWHTGEYPLLIVTPCPTGLPLMRRLEISLPGHAVPGVGLRRRPRSAKANRRPVDVLQNPLSLPAHRIGPQILCPLNCVS